MGDTALLTISRDVTKDECPWLDETIAAGEQVYLWTGYTYGVVGPGGVPVSREPGEYPFFEVPRSALEAA